jgi:hypothetical protein
MQNASIAQSHAWRNLADRVAKPFLVSCLAAWRLMAALWWWPT